MQSISVTACAMLWLRMQHIRRLLGREKYSWSSNMILGILAQSQNQKPILKCRLSAQVQPSSTLFAKSKGRKSAYFSYLQSARCCRVRLTPLRFIRAFRELESVSWQIS